MKNVQEKNREVSILEKEKRKGEEEKTIQISKLKQDQESRQDQKNEELAMMFN